MKCGPEGCVRSRWILDRVQDAALKTQEIRDFITNDGAEPVGSSPQEFAAYLRSEIERYTKVVKAANLKLE